MAGNRSEGTICSSIGEEELITGSELEYPEEEGQETGDCSF